MSALPQPTVKRIAGHLLRAQERGDLPELSVPERLSLVRILTTPRMTPGDRKTAAVLWQRYGEAARGVLDPTNTIDLQLDELLAV